MAFRGTVADIENLRQAIEQSRLDLVPFCAKRRDIITSYVGPHYGPDGSRRSRVPLNKLNQFVTVYTTLLAGAIPQVLVKAKNPRKRWFAEEIEAIINEEVRRINLGTVLQEAVIDALFLMGIVKIGLDYAGNKAGNPNSQMEPFAEIVHADDWVQDMSAQKYEYAEFSGNLYSVPVDFFRDGVRSGFYRRSAASKVDLSPTGDLRSNEMGEQVVQSLSMTHQRADQLYRPFVKLWDIWLPDERILITIPGGREAANVLLRVVELEADEEGPYEILGFNDVPGNPIPSPPINHLYDMHLAINDLTAKTTDQALRQKTTWGYQGGMEEQARRQRDAQPDEFIQMDDPKGVVPFRQSELDQQVQAYSMYLENRFDIMSGNLGTLSGSKTNAPTMGQEQQLLGQATRQISSMREKTNLFVERIIRKLAWRWWNDRNRTYESDRPIAGTDLRVPVEITPQDRMEEDIRGFDMLIDPYSMVYQGPAERLQTLIQVVGQAAQLMPLIQAQGGQINAKKLFALISRYTNMPELNEVIEFGEPQQTTGSSAPQKPAMGEGPRRSESTGEPSLQDILGMMKNEQASVPGQ